MSRYMKYEIAANAIDMTIPPEMRISRLPHRSTRYHLISVPSQEDVRRDCAQHIYYTIDSSH